MAAKEAAIAEAGLIEKTSEIGELEEEDLKDIATVNVAALTEDKVAAGPTQSVGM